MTREQFIEQIAPIVQKYASQYNILCPSAVISQAVLESAGGTSELAINANNYFGLKYRPNRCPTACGIYNKVGSEQNAQTGAYVSSAMQWMKFANMDDGIHGYYDFINIANYKSVKGVTDPKTYLQNIKNAGYCTSVKYVDNCMAVIQKYNLTKYDPINQTQKGETNMANPVIALSAGHGLYTAGKRCKRSIDPSETREWYLNDRIIDKVEQKLKAYNCTVVRVNDTTGKTDTALSARAKTSDNANADVYLSMHHNAGINGGSGGGTVVLYYSSNANRPKQAQQLYNAIVAQTGLVGNRSSKVVRQNVYECRVPKAPAFLVENGFMDSVVDVPIILTESHAEKTAIGVVNFLVDFLNLTKNGTIVENTTTVQKPSTLQSSDVTEYIVQRGDTLSKIGKATGVNYLTIAKLNGLKSPYLLKVGQVLKIRETVSTTTTTSSNTLNYNLVFNATYYANAHADLRKAFGYNQTKLLNHFKEYGMKEGRKAIGNFDVKIYKAYNADLQKAFGDDYVMYFEHYMTYGYKEGRKAV